MWCVYDFFGRRGIQGALNYQKLKRRREEPDRRALLVCQVLTGPSFVELELRLLALRAALGLGLGLAVAGTLGLGVLGGITGRLVVLGGDGQALGAGHGQEQLAPHLLHDPGLPVELVVLGDLGADPGGEHALAVLLVHLGLEGLGGHLAQDLGQGRSVQQTGRAHAAQPLVGDLDQLVLDHGDGAQGQGLQAGVLGRRVVVGHNHADLQALDVQGVGGVVGRHQQGAAAVHEHAARHGGLGVEGQGREPVELEGLDLVHARADVLQLAALAQIDEFHGALGFDHAPHALHTALGAALELVDRGVLRLVVLSHDLAEGELRDLVVRARDVPLALVHGLEGLVEAVLVLVHAHPGQAQGAQERERRGAPQGVRDLLDLLEVLARALGRGALDQVVPPVEQVLPAQAQGHEAQGAVRVLLALAGLGAEQDAGHVARALVDALGGHLHVRDHAAHGVHDRVGHDLGLDERSTLGGVRHQG